MPEVTIEGNGTFPKCGSSPHHRGDAELGRKVREAASRTDLSDREYLRGIVDAVRKALDAECKRRYGKNSSPYFRT